MRVGISVVRRGRPLLAMAVVLLVVAMGPLTAGAGHVGRGSGFAPVQPPAIQSLACTDNGTTVTCELWATTGTLALPDGTNVPVWGYSSSAGGAASVPGPTIVVPTARGLDLTLHNLLTEQTSLAFIGQPVAPDLVGIANGAQTTYSFAAADLLPGTYLYQAGLVALDAGGAVDNGARQAAMGMYGALIVRSATAGQAYDDPRSTYDDEALFLLSDIDPDMNANPAGFGLEAFKAEYFLINGKAYPATDRISVSPGQRLLLRQLNVGSVERSLAVLGAHQEVIAGDGAMLPYTHLAVGETIGVAQTMDTVLTVPAGTTLGAALPVYEGGLHLYNANQRTAPGGPLAMGGMLTFLEAIAGSAAADAGPLTNGLTATPDSPSVPTQVTLAGTVTDVTTGGQNVATAEYFVNALGTPGTGTVLSSAYGTPTVAVSVTIPTATLAALGGAEFTFYVRGQDSLGNWGAPNSVVYTLDTGGPDTIDVTMSPNPTNGSTNVVIRGTADDTANGGSNIAAVRYSIDGGAPVAATVSTTAVPVAGFEATIAAATVAALTEGAHVVTIESQDMPGTAVGTFGLPNVQTLMIDKTGPSAADLALSPNAIDLTAGLTAAPIRLQAVLTDPTITGVASSLVAGEYFFDTLGTPGAGAPLMALDGQFNGNTEVIFFDIPPANFSLLAQGPHTIVVHGRDAAGNWGPGATIAFTVDKGLVDADGPIIDTVVLTPNPSNGWPTVQLAARAADPQYISNIAAAEWFIGTDPGAGSATAMAARDGVFDLTVEELLASIDVTNLPDATYAIGLRARDASGFWGPTVTVQLDKTGALTFMPLVRQ
ncbi:MAG: multicopper oxidase domain-containing protein [Anaerolineae bacterium]